MLLAFAAEALGARLVVGFFAFETDAFGVDVFFGSACDPSEDLEDDLRVVIRPDSLQWVTATGQSV
ncbi:hypothetical protein OCEANICA350_10406 [Oceanicaulis sp. 350]|nr:hypothetical protein OCEANICA350_10406 [Oceanicaulis sp. 350]